MISDEELEKKARNSASEWLISNQRLDMINYVSREFGEEEGSEDYTEQYSFEHGYKKGYRQAEKDTPEYLLERVEKLGREKAQLQNELQNKEYEIEALESERDELLQEIEVLGG